MRWDGMEILTYIHTYILRPTGVTQATYIRIYIYLSVQTYPRTAPEPGRLCCLRGLHGHAGGDCSLDCLALPGLPLRCVCTYASGEWNVSYKKNGAKARDGMGPMGDGGVRVCGEDIGCEGERTNMCNYIHTYIHADIRTRSKSEATPGLDGTGCEEAHRLNGRPSI